MQKYGVRIPEYDVTHRTLFQHLKPWSEERTPPGGRVLYMYMLAVVCADDIMYAMSFI